MTGCLDVSLMQNDSHPSNLNGSRETGNKRHTTILVLPSRWCVYLREMQDLDAVEIEFMRAQKGAKEGNA